MAQTENLHGRPAAGPWLACLISLTGAIVVGANLIGGGRPPQVIAAALAVVAAVQATGALAAAARQRRDPRARCAPHRRLRAQPGRLPVLDARPHRAGQAVVDMWGPADLGDFRGSPGWVAAISGVPAHPNPALLARIHAASPLYNVTPAAPPFLIIHGEDDWFVAPHHSRDLAARLKAAGADVTLIPVRGDAHGLAATSSRHGQDPQPQVLVQAIADFFSRTLGQSPVA